MAAYTSRQVNYFFPDDDLIDIREHLNCVRLALDKIEFCYSKVLLPRYFNGQDAMFNHLYSDHYVMYLWYLANSIWKVNQDKSIANKLYYLNKSLHGFDCMYDTLLPDIFLVFHGVGTMLGKASYADYFVVLQGCTVGMNKGEYPVLGKGVALTAHSSLIGKCNVGDRVTISSYTNIIDTDIPSNSILYKDQDGRICQKSTSNSYAQSFFKDAI